MTSLEAGTLVIRIGTQVENESERSTLCELVRLPQIHARRAIVFANFETGGSRSTSWLPWTPYCAHAPELSWTTS